MADPLFDTLFRPTAPAYAPGRATDQPGAPRSIASAAPVRQTGMHTRAGNAMGRTRAALLDGARRAVETSGTKITMAQVATAAGVAKATLYNHFRTREAVLDALLLDEVRMLAERASALPLGEALVEIASAVSDNPMLRTLARLEPATVAALGRIDRSAPGWQRVASSVGTAVSGDGRGGADLVLRWLASFVLTPARSSQIADDVTLLVAALPVAVADPARPAEAPIAGQLAG